MPFEELYRRQVRLLIRVLPHIASETCFALKGGTAINLFVRNLPRLSVDIDLTYLPIEPREVSLAAISDALSRIATRIRDGIAGTRIAFGPNQAAATKLVVRADGVQVKIEVTPVLRGCVFDPGLRSVSPAVEDQFGFAEVTVVSFADLYGGKIVAALDRQHPRDLFDIRELLAAEGISSALRQAFIVYLISHDRPMSEVLAPTRRDLNDEYVRGFQGMTDQPVTIEELETARETLIREVVGNMPGAHREFLISFEEGTPNWALLGITGMAELPAVRWRQTNLDKLSPEKRATLVAALKAVLAMSSGRSRS